MAKIVSSDIDDAELKASLGRNPFDDLQSDFPNGDENNPACGLGRDAIDTGDLSGRIYLHLGDDAAYRAMRCQSRASGN